MSGWSKETSNRLNVFIFRRKSTATLVRDRGGGVAGSEEGHAFHGHPGRGRSNRGSGKGHRARWQSS